MFWASAAGEILAQLGLSLYREWARNQSIRNDERAKMALAAAELALRALTWKARAAGEPGGGAELGVRDDAGHIELPGFDAGAGSKPGDGGVPPERPG